jgi:hypothetical protein
MTRAILTVLAVFLVAVGSPNARAAQSATTDDVPGKLLRRDATPLIILRGQHPRQEGIWPQYLGLDTGLRQNISIIDVIYPDSPWENFRGELMPPHDEDTVGATNFANTHNHYQNVLSEVWNFKRATNAVSIWGDSASLVDGAKSWGAFFSARSNATSFLKNKHIAPYWPAGLAPNDPTDFDCQLIGVEIDVLNGGKPGVNPNMSKTGLQIVGFGNPNSMGVEIRSQGAASKDPTNWKGQFANGIYFLNSITPDGRLLVADVAEGQIGLDLRRPLFKRGAISLRSEGAGTGILYNGGRSGEIYGGLRWPEFEDKKNWLTLRAGDGGIRMASRNNQKEIFRADNNGGIYFRGTIYVNGKKIDFDKLAEAGLAVPPAEHDRGTTGRDLLFIGLATIIIALGIMVVRLQSRLVAITTPRSRSGANATTVGG